MTEQERQTQADKVAASIGRAITGQRMYRAAIAGADRQLLSKLRTMDENANADRLIEDWHESCSQASRAVTDEAITAELLRMRSRR